MGLAAEHLDSRSPDVGIAILEEFDQVGENLGEATCSMAMIALTRTPRLLEPRAATSCANS